MTARPVILVLASALVAAAPASAQDAERYRMERSEDGFVRMDLATGQMSVCRERGVELVCRAAVDEREAYHREIGDLETRLERLEERVAELERPGSQPQSSVPSEQDFEQTLNHMERFFRRFLGLVREFDEEPAPDRT
ncbi:hypothetical protein GRZ55_16690 [Chelativorans sp. ZYF759]|uniref:hypothetical protein n=1 Tax=Chelativorans sp. ZYF759 TaxID=2692213 RepID=UPI00145DFB63|nr:hypothetical protein [Chelativorans sp. ZYF759]NMG40886.1 hypothetical protein [Chelativorans sp. ZYF759]